MSNFAGMDGLVIGLLIPLVGTVLGAGFVFFMRDTMPAWLQKVLLGFASGVMVAASVWSLLIPSMELSEDMGRIARGTEGASVAYGNAHAGRHHP